MKSHSNETSRLYSENLYFCLLESLEDPPNEAPPPPPLQESSESETDDVETVIDADEKQDPNIVQDIPTEKLEEKHVDDKTSPRSSKSTLTLESVHTPSVVILVLWGCEHIRA